MAEGYNEATEYFNADGSRIMRDALTGVYDRQTMVGYMEWLISRGTPFSFFFIDVDNFKNINDTYGHIAGDVVLADVAHFLEKMVEGKGVVGRYGGDEFMLILENITDYSEIWDIGHAINMGLTMLEPRGMEGLTLTLSMGISRFPLNAYNFNGVVTLADKVLYRAKMKGRNCFIIYLPEKHAHINLKETREAKFSGMQLCSRAFGHLTAYGEDISVGIYNLFKHIVSYFMFDHICIQDRQRINFDAVYGLAEQREFSYIPRSAISRMIDKVGYANITNSATLNADWQQEFRQALDDQNIKSTFICEITAYDKRYGFIRVDTVKTIRIWQENEMATLIAMANAIGLILYYQKKKLEDLPLSPQNVVGEQE